jgi:hypothetical protein
MTNYKVIPDSERAICGVAYVEAEATFDNGSTMIVTKRLSEINLEQFLFDLWVYEELSAYKISKDKRTD